MINYLALEELQQLINSVLPAYKIRGENITNVQVLRDRILLGCMALQGYRSIEMYRANLEGISHDESGTSRNETSLAFPLVSPTVSIISS